MFYPRLLLWTYVLIPTISLLLPTFIMSVARAQQQRAKVMTNALTARTRAAAALARNHQRRFIPNNKYYSGSFAQRRPFKVRSKRESETPMPHDFFPHENIINENLQFRPPLIQDNERQERKNGGELAPGKGLETNNDIDPGFKDTVGAMRIDDVWNKATNSANEPMIHQAFNQPDEAPPKFFKINNPNEPQTPSIKGVSDIVPPINEKHKDGSLFKRSHWDQQEESMGQLQNMWNMNNFGNIPNSVVMRSIPENTQSESVGSPRLIKQRDHESRDYYSGAFSGRNVFDGILEEPNPMPNNETLSFSEQNVASPEPEKPNKNTFGEDPTPFLFPLNNQHLYAVQHIYQPYDSSYTGGSEIIEIHPNEQLRIFDIDAEVKKRNQASNDMDLRSANPDPTIKLIKKKLKNKFSGPAHPYPQHSSHQYSPYHRDAQEELLVHSPEEEMHALITENQASDNMELRSANPDPTIKLIKKKLKNKFSGPAHPYPQHSSHQYSPYHRDAQEELLVHSPEEEMQTLITENQAYEDMELRSANPDPTIKLIKKKLKNKLSGPAYSYPQHYYSSYSTHQYNPYYRDAQGDLLLHYPEEEIIENQATDNMELRSANPDPTIKLIKKKLKNKLSGSHQQQYYSSYSTHQYNPYHRDAQEELLIHSPEEEMQTLIMENHMDLRSANPDPTKKFKKHKKHNSHHRDAEEELLVHTPEEGIQKMIIEPIDETVGFPEPTLKKKKKKFFEKKEPSFYYPSNQYNSYSSANVYHYDYPYRRQSGVEDKDPQITPIEGTRILPKSPHPEDARNADENVGCELDEELLNKFESTFPHLPPPPLPQPYGGEYEQSDQYRSASEKRINNILGGQEAQSHTLQENPILPHKEMHSFNQPPDSEKNTESYFNPEKEFEVRPPTFSLQEKSADPHHLNRGHTHTHTHYHSFSHGHSHEKGLNHLHGGGLHQGNSKFFVHESSKSFGSSTTPIFNNGHGQASGLLHTHGITQSDGEHSFGQGFSQNSASSQAISNTFNNGGFRPLNSHSTAQASSFGHGGQIHENAIGTSSAAIAQAGGNAFNNGGFGQAGAQATAVATSSGANGRPFFGNSNAAIAQAGATAFQNTGFFRASDGAVDEHQNAYSNSDHISNINLSSDVDLSKQRLSRSSEGSHSSLRGLDLASKIVHSSLNQAASLNGNNKETASTDPQEVQNTMGFVSDIVHSSIKLGQDTTHNDEGFENQRNMSPQGFDSITDIVESGLRIRRQAEDGNNVNTLTGIAANRLLEGVENTITEQVPESSTNSVIDTASVTHQQPDITTQQEFEQTLSNEPEFQQQMFMSNSSSNISSQIHSNNSVPSTTELSKEPENTTESLETLPPVPTDIQGTPMVDNTSEKEPTLGMINPDLLTSTPETTIEPWSSNWDYKNNKEIHIVENDSIRNSSNNVMDISHDDLTVEDDNSVYMNRTQENANFTVIDGVENGLEGSGNASLSAEEASMLGVGTPAKMSNETKFWRDSSLEAADKKETSIENRLEGTGNASSSAEEASVLGVGAPEKMSNETRFWSNDSSLEAADKNETRIEYVAPRLSLNKNEGGMLSENATDNSTANEDMWSEKETDLSALEDTLPFLFHEDGTRKNISELTLDEIEELQFDIPINSTKFNETTQLENNEKDRILPISYLKTHSNNTIEDIEHNGNGSDDMVGMSFAETSRKILSKSLNSSQLSVFNMTDSSFASIEAEMSGLTDEEKEEFIRQEANLIAEVIEESLKKSNSGGAYMDQQATENTNGVQEAQKNDTVVSAPHLIQTYSRDNIHKEYRQAESPDPKENDIDSILGQQREKVESIKNTATDGDEDLLMISFIGDSIIKDLENRRNITDALNPNSSENNVTETSSVDDIKLVNRTHEMAASRKKREATVRASRAPLTQLITDPTTKLDIGKTFQNLGSIARHTFENPSLPMYHVRNMLGNTKNSVMSAAKIAPNNFLIPSKYEIARISGNKQSNNEKVGAINPKMLLSRSGFGESEERIGEKLKESSENILSHNSFGLDGTFQKIGGIVKESVNSGKEVVAHANDAALDAKKLLHSTKRVAPRLILPKQRPDLVSRSLLPPTVGSPLSNTLAANRAMLITPKIFEIQSNKLDGAPDIAEHPENFVGMGHLLDASGLSHPNQPKYELKKIVFDPIPFGNKKPLYIPSDSTKLPKTKELHWTREDLKKPEVEPPILGSQQPPDADTPISELSSDSETVVTTETLKDFMLRMHSEMKELVKNQYEERKKSRMLKAKKPSNQYYKTSKDNKYYQKQLGGSSDAPILNSSPYVLEVKKHFYDTMKNYNQMVQKSFPPYMVNRFSEIDQSDSNSNTEEDIANTGLYNGQTNVNFKPMRSNTHLYKSVTPITHQKLFRNSPNTLKNPANMKFYWDKRAEATPSSDSIKGLTENHQIVLKQESLRNNEDEDSETFSLPGTFARMSNYQESLDMQPINSKMSSPPYTLRASDYPQVPQNILYNIENLVNTETPNENEKVSAHLPVPNIQPVSPTQLNSLAMQPQVPSSKIPLDSEPRDVNIQDDIYPARSKYSQVKDIDPLPPASNDADDKVGLYLPPELIKPFMGQATQTLMHDYMVENGDEEDIESEDTNIVESITVKPLTTPIGLNILDTNPKPVSPLNEDFLLMQPSNSPSKTISHKSKSIEGIVNKSRLSKDSLQESFGTFGELKPTDSKTLDEKVDYLSQKQINPVMVQSSESVTHQSMEESSVEEGTGKTNDSKISPIEADVTSVTLDYPTLQPILPSNTLDTLTSSHGSASERGNIKLESRLFDLNEPKSSVKNNNSELEKKVYVELLPEPVIENSKDSVQEQSHNILESDKPLKNHSNIDKENSEAKMSPSHDVATKDPGNYTSENTINTSPQSLKDLPKSGGHLLDRQDLGYVLGAINPLMFERHFNERLKIKDDQTKNAPNKIEDSNKKPNEDSKDVGKRVIKSHQDSTSNPKFIENDQQVLAKNPSKQFLSNSVESDEQVEQSLPEPAKNQQDNIFQQQPNQADQNTRLQDIAENSNATSRTSMKIIDPYKKPFMGYLTKEKINKFLKKYNKDIPDHKEDKHEPPKTDYPKEYRDDKIKQVVFQHLDDEADYNYGY